MDEWIYIIYINAIYFCVIFYSFDDCNANILFLCFFCVFFCKNLKCSKMNKTHTITIKYKGKDTKISSIKYPQAILYPVFSHENYKQFMLAQLGISKIHAKKFTGEHNGYGGCLGMQKLIWIYWIIIIILGGFSFVGLYLYINEINSFGKLLWGIITLVLFVLCLLIGIFGYLRLKSMINGIYITRHNLFKANCDDINNVFNVVSFKMDDKPDLKNNESKIVISLKLHKFAEVEMYDNNIIASAPTMNDDSAVLDDNNIALPNNQYNTTSGGNIPASNNDINIALPDAPYNTASGPNEGGIEGNIEGLNENNNNDSDNDVIGPGFTMDNDNITQQ